MKIRHSFQIVILLAMLLGGSASSRVVRAQAADPVIVVRDLSFWDATYTGSVNDSLYEKWQFSFTATHTFTVTVTPITGDLVPLLLLLNGSGGELTRGTGTLTSTQSAGSYSIQVQPQSGAGSYLLTIREVIQSQASVSTSVNPGSVNVGESAVVTTSLNNIPVGGYASAEFTCNYNATLVQISNIAVSSLFGPDPVVAINDPQNGSFIVAVAGSSGSKATAGGTAFTFNVKGLQAGQTALECAARVSRGDNLLTSLPSTGTNLTIIGEPPTPTSTPTPSDTPTPTSSAPVETATMTQTAETPIETATATQTLETPIASSTPTATQSTSVPSATPTWTLTASPTATTVPSGTITGKVVASKPVTVSLYSGDVLVTSVSANPDGTFSLTALAGSYKIAAAASGFLRAEGSAAISGGISNTKPTINLLAGDIDGNDVIDQFDALTIGMNYNGTTPSAADLNNDGVINVLDLELLAANYRETGPTVWEISYP